MSNKKKAEAVWDAIKKVDETASKVISKTAEGTGKGIHAVTNQFNKGAETMGDQLDNQIDPSIKCKRCRSTDVTFLEADNKRISKKKAIGGTILFGPVGSLFGLAGEKGKKDRWLCNNCHRTFTQ